MGVDLAGTLPIPRSNQNLKARITWMVRPAGTDEPVSGSPTPRTRAREEFRRELAGAPQRGAGTEPDERSRTSSRVNRDTGVVDAGGRQAELTFRAIAGQAGVGTSFRAISRTDGTELTDESPSRSGAR